MKKIILLLVVFFAVNSFFQAEAQVSNYLKKKAKQAATRSGQKADEEVTDEMNKKVDNEVGKVFNKLFNEEEENSATSESTVSEPDEYENESESYSTGSSDNSDAMAKSMMKAFGINTAPANVEDSYNYSGSIRMEVQSWEEDGSTEGSMDYFTYTSEGSSGFAMEFKQPGQAKTTMIFDPKNEAMIILAEENGEKTGMVTTYAGMEDSLRNSVESEENMENADYDPANYNQNLKKTGKTKKIAGYSCDEYIYDDEVTKSNIWMTSDLPADLWKKMFSSSIFAAASFGYYGGFVMEMNQTNKTTSEREYMVVKEVNQNTNTTISTQGYNLISIGVNPEEIE